MSGDVQPRKRKDKKRKKDDEDTVPVQKPVVQVQPPNDDTNIHVYKDSTTGGGICAKLVFFVLFAALISIIGVTITEYRGLTDLDTADIDSRFAQFFAGWIDTSASHDHEHDEDALSPEHASEEEDEESEEQVISDEEHASEEEEEEDAQEEDDEDDEQEEEEEPDETSTEEQDDDDDTETQEDENESDSPEDEEEEDEVDEVDDKEDDKDDVKEDHNSEPKKVAVKIGVGVSILVVAYVVLVRKWKSDKVERKTSNAEPVETPPVDQTRRNTIVLPPSLEEVEPDMENIEEDYSDDDQLEESDGETVPRASAAKLKYRDLQVTYSRSLTPEGEPKALPLDAYEHYKQSDGDDEDEEEDEEDDEVEETDEEDYNDDEELLKKLEEKYGRLQHHSKHSDEEEEDENGRFESWKRERLSDDEDEESFSDDEKKRSGAQSAYAYENITNADDWVIKGDIDEAQAHLEDNAAYALIVFDSILEQYPTSPRALYGKAQALDALADTKRSNQLLQQAVATYIQVLNAPNCPDALFEAAAERCVNRMSFLGRYAQAVSIHEKLIQRFPGSPKYKNQLAITYLTLNKISEAKLVLQQVLAEWPENGLALVHYGFILKTSENKLKEGIYYLKKGIGTKQVGVIDGRFYFHLGDAYARLGKLQEAMKVYEEGVNNKLFLSKYQRSLYNVARLKAQPWWNVDETPHADFFKTLENNWREIRREGLSVMNERGFFKDESENLRDVGDWKQLELYARGVQNKKSCQKTPLTCRLIANFSEASSCKRGQVKFSVMHPGTHVWPHCGPTNCRLRAHLGLKVPSNTSIRVAEEIRSWQEGKVMIFDDSFEHEVWHNGTQFRLILIVDVWHPELTSFEKKSLSPI